MSIRRARLASLTLAALAMVLLVSPTAALAHGDIGSGTTSLVVGWGTEPAYAGFPNTVEVTAEVDGEPRNDARLRVTVHFGEADSTTASEELLLEKAFGRDGTYHASIIPTEAGTYTFRIVGRVGEDEIDETITSGDDTFDDVQEPTELQFPTKLVPQSDLADQLVGQATAATAATDAAKEAKDAASGARIIALIALAVGALSALFGFAALRRSAT